MIVVFCLGLIIGTIAGMFSWIAAAAFIEGKRQMAEGLVVGVAAQSALTKVATESASRPSEEHTGRLFRTPGRHATPAIPLPAMREKQKPRSL